ncbi:hypothetical protein OAP05_00975 [Schleiferiaceae bacterium]|nr:hypothetical protein [Schleiferiaceae bacterium]
MILRIENYTTGFRILNGDTAILRANHVKWYRDAISYEYDDKKGMMELLDLFGTKSNLIKDERLCGEINWNWGIPKNVINSVIVPPWFWGGYVYNPVNSIDSYYLKEPEILSNRPGNVEYYNLIRTTDNETIFSITVRGGFISKPKIQIDYHGSHIDEDLLAFAVFAFKSIQRSSRRPLYT